MTENRSLRSLRSRYGKFGAIRQWLKQRKENDFIGDYITDNHHKAEILANWWDLTVSAEFYQDICHVLSECVYEDGSSGHNQNGIKEKSAYLLAVSAEAAPLETWAKRPDPRTVKWSNSNECWMAVDEDGETEIYLCPSCYGWYEEADTAECTDGLIRCDNCTEDWPTCDGCQRRIYGEEYYADDEYGDSCVYCEECVDECTEYCNECGTRVTNSNWDSQWGMCVNCAQRQEYENPAVFVKTGTEILVLDEYKRKFPDTQGNIISSEIEVYNFLSYSDRDLAISKIINKYIKGTIIPANDGSLGSYGKEFRICPATFDFWRVYGKQYIEPFFEILRKHGHKKDCRAGQHIHIDEQAFKNRMALYNFCRFFHDQHKFTFSFSGRENTELVRKWACPWYNWNKDPKQWSHVLYDWGQKTRYAAVNLERTHDTIEVRIFCTTNDADEFISRINAIRALVELANKSTCPRTISPVDLARYMQKHDLVGYELIENAINESENYV